MKACRLHPSLVASVIAILTGCTATKPVASTGAATDPPFHDDIRGEQVQVRLITFDQWASDYEDRFEIELPDRPPELVEMADQASFRFFDSAAGAVVGAVVDFVQAEIKKEAAKHERQFKGTAYATDFWSEGGQPTYAAFEVIRTTDQHGEDNPAYRLICAFHYSDADVRLCLLKPVYLKIKAAKAKVSREAGQYRIASEADILITGAWITAKEAFVQQDLANASFVHSTYDIQKRPVLKATFESGAWEGDLKDRTYGYFRTPPPSQDLLKMAQTDMKRALQSGDADEIKAARQALGEASRGGAFQLAVLITETDKSKTKDILIKFADYVGAQKQPIIEAVTK